MFTHSVTLSPMAYCGEEGGRGRSGGARATRQSASARSSTSGNVGETRVAPDSVGRAPCDRTRPPRTPRRARTPPPSEAAPEDSSPLKKGRHRPRRRRTRRLTTHEAAAPHNMHATAFCVRTTPAKTGARFRRHATCHAVRLRRPPSHILTSIMAHAARARRFAVSLAPRSSPRLRARRGCLVRAAAGTPRSARTPTWGRTTGYDSHLRPRRARPSSSRRAPHRDPPRFRQQHEGLRQPFRRSGRFARRLPPRSWMGRARGGPRAQGLGEHPPRGVLPRLLVRRRHHRARVHLVPRARGRHRARRARGRGPRRRHAGGSRRAQRGRLARARSSAAR